MKLTKPRLISIPINKLKPIKLNPRVRTEDKKLVTLKNEVERSKLIVPLIVKLDETDNKYWIVDGNRRYNVAKKLELTEVFCCVIDKQNYSLGELFVALNKQLKMDGFQRLMIMRDAGIFFSKSEEKKYTYLLDIGGAELINLMIGKKNNATYTYYWTQRVRNYLGKNLKEDIKTIAYWLVEHKQQYVSRKAEEAKINKAFWWKLITEGKPLQGNFFN